MIHYLFIHLVVQDGERRHDHKILYTTQATNINFAVNHYVATYWGYSKRDGDWWWCNGYEFAIKLESYTELSKEHYDILNLYI